MMGNCHSLTAATHRGTLLSIQSLFAMPVLLLSARNISDIVGQVGCVFLYVLRNTTYPMMELSTEVVDVFRHAFVPNDITFNPIGDSWRWNMDQPNAPLAGDTEHGCTLRQRLSSSARKAGIQRYKVRNRLCIDKRNCVGNLFVLPRGNNAVRRPRNRDYGAQVQFLDGQLVDRDLGDDLCMSLSTPVRQPKRKHPYEQCNHYRSTCRNCGDCGPIPSTDRPSAHFNNDSHLQILQSPLEHTAMAAVAAKVRRCCS